jgi:uncharacterized protein YijF (DUF1287 family)/uncharacterized membrane protein
MMDGGTTTNLSAVWGSSANDVFAVGASGTILHYDGSSWQAMDSGAKVWLRGVWGSESGDVFAVGGTFYPCPDEPEGEIMSYDGSRWVKMLDGKFFSGVWGNGSKDVFVVGPFGPLHYGGSSWKYHFPDCDEPGPSLADVWGLGPTDVFAVGTSGIFHYDGNAWEEMDPGTSSLLRTVWGSGPNDVFAAWSHGTIVHYNGSRWTEMNSPTSEALQDIWGSGPDNVFAVGNYGTIVRYDGGKWNLVDSGTSSTLYGVWGNGRDFFAVGNGGTILHHVDIDAGIVSEARLDIGMPYPLYPFHRGCPSDYVGCGGPYHGFYLGVCTDLVMDSYNAGVPFNIQNALRADHVAHPGRYRWGSARNAEDMRRYFRHNQQLLPHSEDYRVGDVAFFDWTGDGICNHVGVVSRVDENGRPIRMVHATGVSSMNPSGLAFEQDWVSDHGDHSQAHGRLVNAATSTSGHDEGLQYLRITVDSPSVKLRLRDDDGKSTSDSYTESLVAVSNKDAIPYIPGGTYSGLDTGQAITVTWPLSNTTRYHLELVGQEDVTYTLGIEAWQGFSLTDSEVFTQATRSGQIQSTEISLSASEGAISLSATSPSLAPAVQVTDLLELSGLFGTSAQGTFAVIETGGSKSLQNGSISASDLMNQLGSVVSGSALSASPESFTVAAGSTQLVDVNIDLSTVDPGVYRGALVLTSENGGTRSVPLTLDVRFHKVVLPLVLRTQ